MTTTVIQAKVRPTSVKGRISGAITKRGYLSQREIAGKVVDIMAAALRDQMSVITDEPDMGYEDDPYNRGWLDTFSRAHHDAMARMDEAMRNPLGWLPIFPAKMVKKKELELVERYYELEGDKLNIIRNLSTPGDPVDEDAIEEQNGAVDAWRYWTYG